jgi:hypothetical protein
MTPITKDLISLLRNYAYDEEIIYDLLSLGWGYDTLVELGFDPYTIEDVSKKEMNGEGL